MRKQELLEKAEEKAKIFKSRAVEGLDEKRHDRLNPDEREWIVRVHRTLGWSYARIAGALDRDRHTIEKVIEKYVPSRSNVTPCLVIGTQRNRVLDDRLDVAKFASVMVSAKGVEAKGCWGWVKLLPSGQSLPLHWRATPFKEEGTEASRIFIRPEMAATLDVAFTVPRERPKDISMRRYPCREVPRFFEGLTRVGSRWQGEGCWLAQPSALENPDPELEAYLYPGQHAIEVSVGCEGGKGDSRRFTLESPDSWEGLRLSPADSSSWA